MQKLLKALVSSAVLSVPVASCTPAADASLSQPTEVMVDAWGPFARQCTATRASHHVINQRFSPSEVTEQTTTCTGFSVLPDANGSVQITGSTSTNGRLNAPIISRFLRQPSGVSHIAASGDTGLLAQGSDVPTAAESLAREIGVPARQIVEPNGTLLLPVHLDVPSLIEGTLSCHPDGQGVDRGRQILVFSCALDNHVLTDRLDARLHVAGVEEIDVLTGVRLTSVLTGWLTGRQRFNERARWQAADDRIWYHRETELEISPATTTMIEAPR
jgi:hypothetical protein